MTNKGPQEWHGYFFVAVDAIQWQHKLFHGPCHSWLPSSSLAHSEKLIEFGNGRTTTGDRCWLFVYDWLFIFRDTYLVAQQELESRTMCVGEP